MDKETSDATGNDSTNVFAGHAGGNVVQSRDIHGGIHFHQQNPTPATPRQLPLNVANFTGRLHDIETLDALTIGAEGEDSARGAVISAIAGTAGVGKTALAVYWAHHARENFPDGDLYLDLHGYDFSEPVTPSEALTHFLIALGVRPAEIPSDEASKSALYRTLLHDRKVLIVLDNASTPEQVRPLLPASASCFTVITSRSRLTGLTANYAVERLSIDLLTLEESLQLLRNILGSEAVEADRAEASALAEVCVRLPLALRIVAEQIVAGHDTLRSVTADLKASGSLLDEFAIQDDPRLAVRAVFDWSYRSLDTSEALAFRRIGLHAGSDISRDAVTALTLLDSRQAKKALENLVSAHLVEVKRPGRYGFHDLLRVYAKERCSSDDRDEESRVALESLLRWYLHCAELASRQLMPQRAQLPLSPLRTQVKFPSLDSYSEALDWCEEERTNLVLSVRQASQEGVHELAWKLPVALRGFFNIRKHWDDWVATHEIALQSARILEDPYAEGRVLNGLGTAMRQMGRSDAAIEYHNQALALRQKLGDLRGQASVLDSLGNAYRDASQSSSAIDCYKRSLELRQGLDDTHGLAWSFNNLGEAFYEAEEYSTAQPLLEQALVLRRTVSDAWGEGLTLHNLALTHASLGQDAAAETLFQDALSVRRSIRDRWGIAMTLDALGALYVEQGSWGNALSSWTEASAIFEEIQDPLADKVRHRLIVVRDQLRDNGTP